MKSIVFGGIALTLTGLVLSQDEVVPPDAAGPAAQQLPAKQPFVEHAAQPAPPLPVPQKEIKQLAPLPDQLKSMLQGQTALNQEQTAFLDLKKKRVLLHTEVACNDCLLEMFLCREQTKEHESVVAFRGKAYVIHAGLLAVGAKPGKPVTYTPEFKAPTGQPINIFVNWVDDNGKLQRCDARKWMRHAVSRYYSTKLPNPPPGVKLPLMELRYDPYNKEILWYGQMVVEQRDKLLELWDDKQYQAAINGFYKDSQPTPMVADFVFTGSYEFSPEDSDRKIYAAEGGQLVCVANFAESIVDVREASSAEDGGQSYEADPDTVPPRGTPVIVELSPGKATTASETSKDNSKQAVK